MHAHNQIIAEAIDTAPLNRGLKGADWLAFPGNIAVTFDNGDVTLFDREDEGIYEIHVLFNSRGRQAIQHGREAIRTMFLAHGATLIMGLVPVIRSDVKMFARWIGMRPSGLRQTRYGLCELFVLSKFMWKVANQ